MRDLTSLVDKLSAKLAGQKLNGFEVFATTSRGMTLEVKDRTLDVFVAAENAGVSVRAFRDHQLGFAFCTDLSSGSLGTLVDRVLQGIEASDPDPFIGFPSPTKQPDNNPSQFDERLAAIPLEDKIDKVRALEHAARSHDARITKVRKAGYGETTGRIMIRNHTGLDVSYEKTFVSGTIVVAAEEGQEVEMGWDYGFSPFFQSLDMEVLGKNAATRAVGGLGARSIETMEIPVLLPPWVASDVLQVLSESFTADNVQKGKSLLADRIGETVFSSHLTIVDDGLYPKGMATSPVDDEGFPHGTNVVVSHGLLQGFLYDQYTANKAGRGSTGNAGRQGIKAPPGVEPTNFYIENNRLNRNALMASMDTGLFVTDLMGIHTADPISGDFSVGATGVWIEKGETVYPVRGIAVAGNLLDLFRNVDAVGNDLTFYGPFGSPTLRVSRVYIAGPGS
jgi:PmbA protein